MWEKHWKRITASIVALAIAIPLALGVRNTLFKTEEPQTDDVADVVPLGDDPPPQDEVTNEDECNSEMRWELLSLVLNHLPDNISDTLADVLENLENEDCKVRAQAVKDLGHFYANGFEGFPEDDEMANELFELALDIDPDNAQAHHSLGYHEYFGKGTDKNIDSAMEHFKKAAEAEHPLVPSHIFFMVSAGDITPDQANDVLGHYDMSVQVEHDPAAP